ncbi:hypothetical protein KSP39_PZI011771 [Platanthera zijinensis]|uniref:Retroviral polymerase SH3-like domain-containing protein n=1 Tax=Platanthera zijinensis TaxID=2320716 RepID=A0AAP0G506_9ASPA
MPSSILDFATPFSLLFPSKSVFSLTPRVFDCVCYAHLLGPLTDKLVVRATKYIFVDYFRTKKSHVCYSLTDNKLIVSADVTFLEDQPYHYSPSTPSPSSTAARPAVPVTTPSLPPPPSPLLEALQHSGWQADMDEETALWANQTWDLVPLPPDQSCVSCKWVFVIKHAADGTVDRLKSRLVARGIQQIKKHLNSAFQTKDLGNLRYFLGLVVARRLDGLVLSQRKYCIDLLQDAGYTGCKHADTLMDINHKLSAHGSDSDQLLTNPEYYRRLVEKLIYLTISKDHSGINTRVQTIYLLALFGGAAAQRHAADFAAAPPNNLFGVGGGKKPPPTAAAATLKKQTVVARSSAEAEYQAMTAVVLVGFEYELEAVYKAQFFNGAESLESSFDPFNKISGGLFGFSKACLVGMTGWDELNLLFKNTSISFVYARVQFICIQAQPAREQSSTEVAKSVVANSVDVC